MADLRYHVERPGAPVEAVLAFLFDSLGIDAEPARPPELWDGPHLVYGGDPAVRPDGVSIVERAGDLLWHELLDVGPDPRADDGRVPFDLVGAIGAFLRDEADADAPPDASDAHGRLTYAASLPARTGYGHIPIVNVYVGYLERLLRDRLGVVGRPRWPDGKRAAIALSHDVDMPDRYALLQSGLRPWRLRRNARGYARSTARLARARLGDRTPGDFWLFDDVARSERDHGFRSTFFFSAVPFHHAHGDPVDVLYDVRDPRFRPVFERLLDDGFDIGLHASYRAFEEPERLATERAALAGAARTAIPGIRHHYWHLGPDIAATLRGHEAAGFEFDSSIAFNDHVGFRRSVALPFHPFDPVLGRPLRTIQIPTFCMDGNLFYTSDDVEAGVSAVDALVDEIVATGGVGSIDWHIQTSYPANPEFRSWGIAYQEILGGLAGRPDVWVTDMASIARWSAARSAATRATAIA
jgi:hypothetical protein